MNFFLSYPAQPTRMKENNLPGDIESIIKSSSVLSGFLHPSNTSLDSTSQILGNVLRKVRREVEGNIGSKVYNEQIRTTIRNADMHKSFNSELYPNDIFDIGAIVAFVGYQVGDYKKAGAVRSEILKRLVKIKALNYPAMGTLEKTNLLITSLLAVGVNWRKEADETSERLAVFKDYFDQRPDLDPRLPK